MPLRDVAIQAWQDTSASLEDEARAAVADVLAPFDVATLTVAHMEVTASGTTMFVFTDGDVHLAVRQRRGVPGWTVTLAYERGGWVDAGVEITSLAQLGKALADDAGRRGGRA